MSQVRPFHLTVPETELDDLRAAVPHHAGPRRRPSIHFLHVRSPEPDALPLLMTHGWPGSVLEFRKVVGPLTDPVAFGGDARDAFHIIAPSMPGFGFSSAPTTTGWAFEQTAKAWVTLMNRLGHRRWGLQLRGRMRHSGERLGDVLRG